MSKDLKFRTHVLEISMSAESASFLSNREDSPHDWKEMSCDVNDGY